MDLTHQEINLLRGQFPAFQRMIDGIPVAYFDGPAGTQVPQRVADAVSSYLLSSNANHAGLFATAIESDQMLDAARVGFSEFVGADDPAEIYFGQNMTSLTFAFSRAISQTWSSGDEIILTRMDHDANVTPWVLAARDRGIKVNYVDFDQETFRLDIDQLESYLNTNTRLVAVGCAANAAGTINPVTEICRLAKRYQAKVFLDAVHYAPHRLIDVKEFGCDFLVCSAYKFFGPHTGIFWGKRQLLEGLEAYKVRPATNRLPGKWMTGTQSHEGIVGSLEAVDYIADIGRDLRGDPTLGRRDSLIAAFSAIGRYEQKLTDIMLSGFKSIPGIQLFGIADPCRPDLRVATFSIICRGISTADFAKRLCDRGHFVWHGHYYALQFSEQLGLEPEGMVRIGMVHYNTVEEVNRLLDDIRSIASSVSESSG